MIDLDTGGGCPGDDVVEWDQDRFAVEVRDGDRVDGAEQVIGRHHDHRRLLVEGDDGQPRRVDRRPEQRHVDGAGPQRVGRVCRGDGMQLQRNLGVALRPGPSPLRGRHTGDVPDGEAERGHRIRLPIGSRHEQADAQSMKPATAAKKLDVYLPATPAEFQENPTTRAELAALQADPPQWLKDLRKNGPHPKNLVAAKLGVSIAGLARGGITDALTTEQINQLLEEKPEWLVAERESYQSVLREERRLKALHADQAREG